MDHRVVQGEILEGLVVRLVSPRSVAQLRTVIHDHPLPDAPPAAGKGRSLRDIYGDASLKEKQVGVQQEEWEEGATHMSEGNDKGL